MVGGSKDRFFFKTNRQRWRPAATSFMVSFVMALNRVNIVGVNAILVLHVGKTDWTADCRSDAIKSPTRGRSPLVRDFNFLIKIPH